MKTIKLSLILSLISIQLTAQNLVLNPSFEEADDWDAFQCLNLAGTAHWSGHGGFSYFFHKDVKGDRFAMPNGLFSKEALDRGYKVPFNFLGKQIPHSGRGYAALGIKFYSNQQPSRIFNYAKHRMINGELSEPLKKGHTYYAEVYLSLADRYDATTSSFWFLFSDTTYALWFRDGAEDINFKPNITNPQDNYITEKEGWQKVSGTFVAKGGEQFLAIGSSPNESNTKGKGHIYFYIDDVLVKEVKDSLIIEKDKPLILEHIVFASGKSELLPKSFPELEQLFQYLNNHTTTKLELSGHTDNRGNPAQNQALSEARAKAVVDYLTTKGVSAERLTYKGYGASKPITSNDTATGRAKNRRVEVKIIN